MNRENLEDYLPEPMNSLVPEYIERAQGAIVYDKSGDSYIDFSGGWGCLAVGYSHPKVVNAVKSQAEKFFHTDFSAIPYESYPELAGRLSELSPGGTPKKAVFFNSGAEAVENAVKFAKADTGRGALVAFENGFHGRTLLTMALTHKATPYKAGFGPFAPEVYRLPYPNQYRSGVAVEELEQKLKHMVDPEDVAAIIVEPVMGEGGFLVPPDDFLPYLRELSDKYEIDLIFDEIQSGMGRTGKFFACEHFDVEPDLITVAKSLAAGLPLSGVIGREEIMDAPDPGSIGGTYVGNPVAIESALAVLDVMEEEHLLERATEIGEKVTREFTRLEEEYEIVGDVRGLGAMVAMELVNDEETKEPAPEITQEIVDRSLKDGLILPTAGLHNNVIRLLTPLVIEEQDLEEGLEIIERAISKVQEELGN
ncbi:MAG: 4-aminobutyrate--2-oxoglutarate transaminase [Candidatus Bipolaricaulota bacterium]|nr:4-aminobutyrate--2-oxoglutarate transaminase [Candidatus Bipolaricaulota bacterium]MBS3791698.1 4-aminobutyrate--2-oxoglutarate transaminase [Candidatus Bipolaricaulota bacterium]